MSHDSISKIAPLSFSQHVIQDQPARSWRMGQPGRSAYAFRVTWAPGMLSVSGDIGRAVYEIWPAFQTLEGAVDLVLEANFDYLAEKSGAPKEFDLDATVEQLIRDAYWSRRNGDKPRFFAQVCEWYGGDPDILADRKESVRDFRDDGGLSAERICAIVNDSEAAQYDYPSEARWTFEALKLWAKTVQLEALEQAA